MIDTLPPTPGSLATGRRRRGFTGWLWSLRTLAVLQAVILLAQPVWIGQYLAGLYTWLGFHAAGATVAGFALLLTTAVGVGFALTGGRFRVPLTSLALFVAVVVQTAMGWARNLAVHIPLGVLVITGSLAFAIWVCRPAEPRVRVIGSEKARSEKARSEKARSEARR